MKGILLLSILLSSTVAIADGPTAYVCRNPSGDIILAIEKPVFCTEQVQQSDAGFKAYLVRTQTEDDHALTAEALANIAAIEMGIDVDQMKEILGIP